MNRYGILFSTLIFVSCNYSQDPDSNNGHPIKKIYNDVKNDFKSLAPNEDELIKRALVGKTYLDDTYIDDVLVKYRKGVFFESGSMWEEGTFEFQNEEFGEPFEIVFRYEGGWKIKDKYLYCDFRDFSLYSPNDLIQSKIENEDYGHLKTKMLNELKSKNSPDKIIYYGPDKIVIEDVDGKRENIKKTY